MARARTPHSPMADAMGPSLSPKGRGGRQHEVEFPLPLGEKVGVRGLRVKTRADIGR
jgi:hypothetical protein